jgi:hypothetical protein
MTHQNTLKEPVAYDPDTRGLAILIGERPCGFSDYPAYFTPTGGRFFGWIGGAGSLPVTR